MLLLLKKQMMKSSVHTCTWVDQFLFVVVVKGTQDATVAKNLAMQVASMAPKYVSQV